MAADLGVTCAGSDATSTVDEPVRFGSMLVTTWNCLGAGDSGGRLLMSGDDGRTWAPERVEGLDTRELAGPVRLGGDQLVVLGAENREESVESVLRIRTGS